MSLKLYRDIEIDFNTPLCVLKFLISSMGKELDTKTLFERKEEVIGIIRNYKPEINFIKDEHLNEIINYVTPIECVWEKDEVISVFYKVQKFFESSNYKLKFYEFGNITPSNNDRVDVVMLYKIIKFYKINIKVSDTFHDMQDRYLEYLYENVKVEKTKIINIINYSLNHIDEKFLKEIYKKIPEEIKNNYKENNFQSTAIPEILNKNQDYIGKFSDNTHNDKNYLSRYFYPELACDYTDETLEKLKKYYPYNDEKFNLIYNSDKGRITFYDEEFSVETLISVFQSNNFFKNPIKGNEKKLIEWDLINKLYNISILHKYEELSKEIVRVKSLVVDNYPPVKGILNRKFFNDNDIKNYFKEILRFCLLFRGAEDLKVISGELKIYDEEKIKNVVENIFALSKKIKNGINEFPIIIYTNEFIYKEKRLIDCINIEYVKENIKNNTCEILSSFYYYNKLFNFKEYFKLEDLN